MSRTVIQLDGWRIAVDWENMYYSDSFFVPSVNWKHDRRAIEESAQRAGAEVGIKGVTENDVRGLRVWCTQPTI